MRRFNDLGNNSVCQKWLHWSFLHSHRSEVTQWRSKCFQNHRMFDRKTTVPIKVNWSFCEITPNFCFLCELLIKNLDQFWPLRLQKNFYCLKTSTGLSCSFFCLPLHSFPFPDLHFFFSMVYILSFLLFLSLSFSFINPLSPPNEKWFVQKELSINKERRRIDSIEVDKQYILTFAVGKSIMTALFCILYASCMCMYPNAVKHIC